MKRLRYDLEGGIKRLNEFLSVSSGVLIFLIVFATFVDVAGRYFFARPFSGVAETSKLLIAVVIVFSWAHTQALESHIYIDVTIPLPTRTRDVVDMIVAFLGLSIVVLITWQSIPYSLDSMANYEWTDDLHIPVYPFKFLMFGGGLTFCAQLLIDIIEAYRRFRRHSRGSDII